MAIVQYTISNGVPNFIAQLSPSGIIPNNTHTSFGTYYFYNVPDGDYSLIVTDGNNCTCEKSVTVNSLITTTTTTMSPDNSVIIGNTDDQTLIFNIDATNRIDHYVGYPNANEIVTYLWFKTRDGVPIGTNKMINYTIVGNGIDNIVNFIEYINNNNNVFLSQDKVFSNNIISGKITLMAEFVELYVKYSVTNLVSVPEFQIILESDVEVFDNTIDTINNVKVYGVYSVDQKNLIMVF